MRSAEVAKMADVSVRTLRHYHALGLLPEPPRSANGYRDYGPEAVAQVLRVKRLASLGLSLADIKAMAEAPDQQQLEDEALQRLDDELELKIERLQQQRRTIAQLRAEGLDPTLPVRFARALKAFYGDDPLSFSQPEALEADRAALTLAAHFYDEEDVAELERFAERAQAENAIEPLLALEAAIRALEPDAPAGQRANLVAQAIALLEPLLDCLDPANWSEDEADGWQLFDSLLEASQNDAQCDVNRRIEEVLVERMRRRCSDDS